MTFEVRSPEDLSTALLLSALEALSLAFEALRSVVDGRLDGREVEVLGLETSREVDLLYPPLTEGLVEGLVVVVGLELGRLAGLLCFVEGLLLGAGRLVGLDIELLELRWLMRCASSSTGANSNNRTGNTNCNTILKGDFIGKKVLIVYCLGIMLIRSAYSGGANSKISSGRDGLVSQFSKVPSVSSYSPPL